MKSAMYVKNKSAIKKTATALRPVMVQSSPNTEPCIGLLKLITKKMQCQTWLANDRSRCRPIYEKF